MTNNSGNLCDPKDYNEPDKIIIRNRSQLDIIHVGNTTSPGLKLQKILMVPKITKNLLSISKIAKDNSCTLELMNLILLLRTRKQGYYWPRDLENVDSMP